jgi:hypothetical protein
MQFLNGAGQSSKDRVALSMIEIVRAIQDETFTFNSSDVLTSPGRRAGNPNAPFRRHNLRRDLRVNRNLTSNSSSRKGLPSTHVRKRAPST